MLRQNTDGAFKAAQRAYDWAEPPDYGEIPEWQSEAVYYVGDREADDVELEGDVGISIYEGPMSLDEAREWSSEHDAPTGRAWAIVKNEMQAQKDWQQWKQEECND